MLRWLSTILNLPFRGPVDNSAAAGTAELDELRRQLEAAREQLRHAAAAQATLETELSVARDQSVEAVELRSQFLANLSHEIRTPMNAVVGTLELLLESSLTDKQRKYAEIASHGAGSLLTIIEDILDFSRIEAGTHSLRVSDFELRRMVNDTVAATVTSTRKQDVEVISWLRNDLPQFLQGDGARLSQILSNLLGNAIKFTPRGEVFLGVRRLQAEGDCERIEFEIADTGIGIPAEKLDRIFESFTQLDGSNTRDYGGTGLGLAIAQRLVALMNGTIDVESEVGVGSLFRVVIPFSPSTSRSEVTAPLPINGRVVVIEPNSRQREVLADYLSTAGLEVIQAENPASVHTGDGPFDVVVSSTMDAETNLDQLSATIYAQTGSLDVPIIFVARVGADIRGNRKSAARMIAKPIRRSELLAAVRQAATGAIDDSPDVDLAPRQDVSHKVQGLRVLVAEDAPLNRFVVLGFLEQLGIEASYVSDGYQAVQAFTRDRPDVILMDCQMPVMDGLEATKRIRAWEAERSMSADDRVWIIALTAHAMDGDRERCLEVGMDDYLCKPFRANDLHAVVARSVPHIYAPVAVPSQRDATLPHIAIDWEQTLFSMPPTQEKRREHIEMFVTEASQELRELQDACVAEDIEKTRAYAHRLKGAFAMFGLNQLSNTCEQMEAFARAGWLEEIEPLVSDLADDFSETMCSLEEWSASETVTPDTPAAGPAAER